MNKLLPWAAVCLLSSLASGCIIVQGDDLHGDPLGDEGEDETGFYELSAALEGCLVDPVYDLDLVVNPWSKDAEWTVSFVEEGSDPHAAFRRARAVVLARIEREGGTVTEQHGEGPHAWACSFRMDGEPCEAAVRLVENDDEDEDGARPHRLEVVWEESD